MLWSPLRACFCLLLAGMASLVFPQTIDAYILGEETAAVRASRMGARVISRDSRAGLVRVRIAAANREAFAGGARSRGLAIARWEPSPSGASDLGSLVNVERQRRLLADQRKGIGKSGAPSYFERQREWLYLRAKPFDRIDTDAIEEARLQMQRMRPFVPPKAGEQRLPASWKFVGATNLAAPASPIYFGTGRLAGRVNAIAYDPSTPSVIYAGKGRGGLWKSVDNGANWALLSGLWPSQNVNCIHMASSTLIYVGLGDLHGGSIYGNGIMKSTDAGATWTHIGASAFGTASGVSGVLSIPGTNGQTLLACVGGPGRGFLYRSTNGGANWTIVNAVAGLTWTGFTMSPFAIDFSGTRTIYAVSSGVGPYRLWRSKDNGLKWQGLTLPGTLSTSTDMWHFAAAASQVKAGTVYFQANKLGKVYKSDDYGATWSDITGNMPTANGYNFSQWDYNYHLTTSKTTLLAGFPPQPKEFDVLYAGNIDLTAYCEGWGGWVSAGGPTYSVMARTHNDQHSMAIHPTDPSFALVGNDGGLYMMKLDPSLPTGFWFYYWSLNANLPTHLYQHFDVHSLGRIVAGSQDNGFQRFNLADWGTPIGGDGMYGHINKANPLVQYGSTQNHSMWRTGDGWTTRASIAPARADGEVDPFVGRTHLDANNEDYLFAGTNYVHVYRASTNAWTYSRTPLVAKPDFVTAFDSMASSPLLAAGFSNGKLFTTTTRSGPWLDSTGDLPALSITSISINPANSNDALVSLAGTSWRQVMRTANFLSAAPTWVPLVGSGQTALPNATANIIVRDPKDPANKWWLGTDLGVFTTSDAGKTWLNATTSLGLPSVEVTHLKFGPGGAIYASTFGRGIWRFQTNPSYFKSFTFSPAIGKRGDSVYATVELLEPLAFDTRFAMSGLTIPGATMPASLSIKAGSTSFGFLIGLQNATATGSSTIRVMEPSGFFTTRTLTVVNPIVQSFTIAPASVRGPQPATGSVTLDSPAALGSNTFSIAGGTATATAPASVTIPPGSKTATFTITTKIPAQDQSATFTVAGKSATLTVQRPRLKNLYLDKLEVVGGQTLPINARIELDENAGPGGLTIQLADDSAALSTPNAITIPEGQRFSNWLTITSSSVAANTYVKVTATQKNLAGVVEATDSETVAVLVNGIKSFTLSSSTVLGGASLQGTVELFAPAPSWGYQAPMSDDSNFVTVPQTLYYPAGHTKLTFTITTLLPPYDVTAVLRAGSAATGKTATLKVLWNGVKSASASPSTIKWSSSTIVTVALAAPAPAGGAVCTVSFPAAWPIAGPTSVTVAAGSTKGTFTMSGKPVTSAFTCNVLVSYKGIGAYAPITVLP